MTSRAYALALGFLLWVPHSSRFAWSLSIDLICNLDKQQPGVSSLPQRGVNSSVFL